MLTLASAQLVRLPARVANAVSAAERLYRDRRHRAQHFPMAAGLFGEPAFDLLLDLFIQGERGHRVPITSAVAAADVPASTALRYVGHLIDTGLVDRVPDPADRRRHFVRLSSLGRTRMLAYLDER